MLSNECHEETIFSLSRLAPQPPPERRRELRHLTILRVGALIGPQGRELCLIRNISAGGLMAHVYSHHSTGSALAVELKSNQPVPGRVVWADQSNVGIEFDSLIDVEEMLSNQAALENGWRPRLPRVEIDRMATLRAGARTYWVHSRDISQGGVKVELDEAIEPNTEVVVTLEDLRPVAGRVRWQGDGVCGIAFNQLIPFDELIAWLKRDC